MGDVVTIAGLASAVRSRRAGGGRLLLGIAGPPAAGKSTLAELLRDALNHDDVPGSAQVAPMDGFHRTNADLAASGDLHRKGEPDTFDAEAFVRTLRLLRSTPVGEPVPWPTFDRVLDDPSPGGVVIVEGIVIVEGNYLLLGDRDGQPWSGVRPLLDEVWYLDAATVTITERLLRRQGVGRSQDEARRKVTGSDLPNAALVATTRSTADRVLREQDGAYVVVT